MKTQGNLSLNDLINSFNRGFRTVSGFHISLASLLGITGFVFALREGKLSRFWWSNQTQAHEESSLSVPGLQNLGNNCFLNVILQALASCSCFQSFVQRAVEECEKSVADEDLLDSLPLGIALDSLLEDLCMVDGGKVVLSPRRVMLSMAHYFPNFNLTAQQDAAEAFLHLLSSLREEFAGCYDTRPRSLLELCSSNRRIIIPKREEDLTEQERWQRSFIGPFDGILCSILTCQSCSSQISLNFEAFHSLPLSPVLDNGSTIMAGCSLEDCLKQFTVAEQVENYHCTHCWHIAGAKYLSAMGTNETEIEKLRACTKQDFCDCRRTYGPDIFPWSNQFSRTLKQISIARSPKILCIHLKRVSVNMFGDLVKLQGHISFPLILDLFSFMASGVEINPWEESLQRQFMKRRYLKPSFHAENVRIHYETTNSDNALRESIYSEEATDLSVKSGSNKIQVCSNKQSTEQVATSSHCLYRLASVVEHFGRAGSGHYTVYRSARADSSKNEPADQPEPYSACWFCISDSEVHLVSEKDVLAAEASLLFYERISQT